MAGSRVKSSKLWDSGRSCDIMQCSFDLIVFTLLKYLVVPSVKSREPNPITNGQVRQTPLSDHRVQKKT